MRMLFISPLFAPTVNAEAFVGAKMAQALAQAGVEVTVVHDPSSAENSDVEDGSDLWKSIGCRIEPVPPPENTNVPATLVWGAMYRVGRIYPRWIRRVVTRARAWHRERPFDVVYSRSLPMRAHLAGCWTSRALGVPWVANINDPWDLHLFPGAGDAGMSAAKRRVSDAWLRRTLEGADVVTFPSRRLAAYHARLAGVPDRAQVVPHVGWKVPGDAVPAGLHLVHAGTLGADRLSAGRPADGLLRGLAAFLHRRPEARARVTLSLIGGESAAVKALAAELGAADAVSATGRVDYETSLTHIARATACVLVEGDMPEGIYLPSKLADYVAADKPVLALSPREGTVADMMPDAGLVRADVLDDEAIAQAIEKLYDAADAGRLDTMRPSPALRARFDAAVVARQFLALLSDAGVTA